jgi:branched-chain amino acid transport system permease protein
MQYAQGGLAPFFLKWLPKKDVALVETTARLPRRQLPAPGTPLLSATALKKNFGGLVAVDNVALSINAAEIVGLIGPNGAGKTTMLNLLSGALKPSGGSIIFRENDVTGRSPSAAAALGMARTFQQVRLSPGMTVLENVLLGTYGRTSAGIYRAICRLNREEERAANMDAMHHLQWFGLAKNARDLAGNLPLGSQRLLEVARALAADPALIVLDEPAAGLRRPEKEALKTALRAVRDVGVAILVVEHDVDFVMNLADRVLVLNFGQQLAEGKPSEIRANAKVRHAYLGNVP